VCLVVSNQQTLVVVQGSFFRALFVVLLPKTALGQICLESDYPALDLRAESCCEEGRLGPLGRPPGHYLYSLQYEDNVTVNANLGLARSHCACGLVLLW
jgi:hypothetical protein